jgi:predicted enzyme related to lactoylglutathione lyase
MTSYAHGTPSWVDLATPAPDASAAFYGELFGWTTTEPRPDFGGYANFLDGGRRVGGLNPMGESAAWRTYVAVDDAEAIAAEVAEQGGTVLLAPTDVGDLGRMAVFQDPQGTDFGVWQAGEFAGAEKVNVPVSLCWNELNSRDLDAVRGFYEAVFGWTAAPTDMGEMIYTVFNLGESSIGGGLTLPPQTPAEVPGHWLVWFSVVDRDATVARAGELGAEARIDAMDVPGVGRLAVLVDPQGAAFGVMQGETPDE